MIFVIALVLIWCSCHWLCISFHELSAIIIDIKTKKGLWYFTFKRMNLKHTFKIKLQKEMYFFIIFKFFRKTLYSTEGKLSISHSNRTLHSLRNTWWFGYLLYLLQNAAVTNNFCYNISVPKTFLILKQWIYEIYSFYTIMPNKLRRKNKHFSLT